LNYTRITTDISVLC